MIGIGVWLRLDSDVSVPCSALLMLLGIGWSSFVFFRRRGIETGLFASAIVSLIVAGYLAGSVRVVLVDAPVLSAEFRGKVEGRVIAADRSRSEVPRVMLDRLRLAGVHPAATPERIRISLIDAKRAPPIGAVISVDGILSSPSGPAAPGAFDFSRQAFFRQIGGVGYARGAVTILSGPNEGVLWLERVRADISKALRDGMSGEEGAVAAALIVGDRAHIAASTTESLRDSGLAHLLAISGLHIGLMSALMFWLVRFALALMPIFASRIAIRKGAAVAGLIAAAGYLALAGFGVATQRAFIMTAVAFLAILLDRPAVTARGLAAAACLVLLIRPESLFEAGFQMSFAAVAALVAGYEISKPFWRKRADSPTIVQRFLTGIIATVVTSLIAGAATAPFAAYHFNRLVAYGLPANVLATPVMGLWIMPAIILTAALAPFGLAWLGLALLGWGIGYVLWVADFVASLEGAAWSVPAGSSVALAVIVFGGLWLVIWRGPLRVLSLPLIIIGISMWRATVQPDLLISEDARLIAGRLDTGSLWISRKRNSGYSAETWLRRNGEGDVSQIEAFERRQWRCTRTQCSGETSHRIPVALIRNRSAKAVQNACIQDAIVIAPKMFVGESQSADCTIIDRNLLDSASSISITLEVGARPLIKTAHPTSLSVDQ
jgi:competence protein ComEC